MARTLCFHCRGQIPSMNGKLRSQLPVACCSKKKKKKKKNPDFKTDLWEIKKHQLCKETYYAILTEEQFKIACTYYGKFEVPPINKERFPILPAAEVDLKGARLVNMENRYIDVEHIIESRMPCRRTTGNQLRRPLAFVLDVADIPLMFAAAPVGWVSRLIYYSLD